MARKKIIIIGGGVAGLSAGIYGQMNGFDTEIIEMHNKPGGQCTAWERGGYHFDYCIHWLVGTRRSAFHTIWKETHALTDEVRVTDSSIHSCVTDTQYGKFYIYSNIDEWRDYLLRFAPEDARPIRRMCRHMKKSVRLEPFENPPRQRSIWAYMKLLFTLRSTVWLMWRYRNMTAQQYFESLRFRNEKLNYFLQRLFGDMNFSALVFILMLSWFHDKNAGYPIGGSLHFAGRMAGRYHALGGTMTLNTRVEKILVENDRAIGVQLADGRKLQADIVISAADGYTTLYRMLEGKYLEPRFTEAYTNWKLFSPFVQVSFGINGKVNSEQVTMSYWQTPFPLGGFMVNNGFYIMNQTLRDPTLAPEGKTSLILRFDSPWADWENMPDAAYTEAKERIRKDAVALLETLHPEVTGKIEVVDVSTPLTGHRITGVWKGAYEGFTPEGDITVNALPDRLPGLKQFYMVGQWLIRGGGLPPAAQSGKWLIQTICSENKMKFRVTG